MISVPASNFPVISELVDYVTLVMLLLFGSRVSYSIGMIESSLLQNLSDLRISASVKVTFIKAKQSWNHTQHLNVFALLKKITSHGVIER